MDRISKALELARRGRQPAAPDNRSGGEAKKDIKYSRTQVVSVDQEELARNRVISAVDEPGVVDAYKLLRTRVFHRLQQNQWVAMGVTSPNVNTGKTLTAINLAISLAMKQNYTVVLVDADLRRPTIHSYLGISPEFGLRDYLEEDTPVEEILLHPRIDRLVLLPGKGTTAGASDLLASPKMNDLVHELKTRYPGRLVVFDLPPVLLGDDVVAFAPQLDATMLVVEDGGTRADDMAKTLELLEGVNLLGTVLNKCSDDRNVKEYDYY